ncbi:DUF7507 domain-containing protein [Microbacterium sp. A94]|uniref:DUF7507 domain-containing protein n=1 Tax=Microbacterium sp. A94 TaxID=3450717 RepID=UPI003F42229B
MLSGAVALVLGSSALVVATPAFAATEYEIAAVWADGTPTTVASGDVVTAEIRVNVNDGAAAPSNEPVDNVNFIFTIESGTLQSLPDTCLVDGVTPASSISADGKTLICNLGTKDQGTAHVVNPGILVEGPTGAQLTGAATIDGTTADVPAVEITNEFALDMAWGNPVAGSTFISEGINEVSYQWTLNLKAGSEVGPDSVSYTITVAADNASAITAAPTACSPFTTGAAGGHPWSGGSNPAEQTAPFAGTCTLTPSGTPGQFTLTLTGIDYSLAQDPTTDSTGSPLPAGWSAVASGQVTFRIATATNTGVGLTSNAPTYTAPGSGATVIDDASNNTSSKAISFVGGAGNNFYRAGTGAGGDVWDDSYRVSAGMTVQQGVSLDTSPQTGAEPTSVFGVCTIIDTRYATLTEATPSGVRPALYPLQYYVGTAPVVDPNSPSYDPNAFDCGTGGNASTGGGGWVTTAPEDLSTVKALRLTYPKSEADHNPYREIINAKVRINDNVPVGQDVWTWGQVLRGAGAWTSPTAATPNTVTPDARYLYTNVYRDILRIITATPQIEKSVDRGIVTPGVPANYTLTYSAVGAGAIPETVDGFQITDTLPVGLTYVAGSATPVPTVTTNGAGQQVLSWTLDGVPTNTQVPLTYQAVAGDVVAGSVLTNNVTAAYGGQTGSDRAQVTVNNAGYTSIGKTADTPFIPNLNGDGVGAGSWTVTLRSFDPLPQTFTDTIDVLPYIGDDRGTSYSGSYELTGVNAVAGATVYYTDADPTRLSDNPAEPTNGAPGDVTGNSAGWSTTMPANPTAVRVIGPELAPGATQAFTLEIATDGAVGGDALVNRAQAIAEHTELVMRTSAPITIANYYSAQLKKYVQDADGEWRDANTVEDYPSFFVGDTIRYRIVVENTGQGTLTGIKTSDDKQPELGSFVIDELAPGDSEERDYEIIADASVGEGVVNTACAAADIPVDSDVAPTINCDPAGFEIEGEPTHTKSIVSAAPIGGGQWEIVYGLEVTNVSTAKTSYSLADELHFTDQVEVVSAVVSGSPDGVTLADPAWDGQGNLDVATNVPLLGNDDEGYVSHSYLLTVVADVPLQFAPGGDLPAAACPAEGEDPDTAFNNTSALTLPGGDIEPDQACATPPAIDITKSVSEGPTPNDDGTWTVTYDVVARNDGGAEGVYDISDRMTADGDLEVVSGSVASAPEGVTPSATWTGLGAEGAEENVIATEVTLTAGGVHTYQVEVVIGLAEGAVGAPVITECAAEPGESGGLSNTAEIEHNDLTDDASACITVGTVTVDKSVSSGPTPNGDGTWTVVYDILATHVGAADADYDVTDRLHFGEGIEIVDAAVTTAPDGVDTNADWTGLGAEDSDSENLVAEGVTLPVGESHLYQVEVTVQMDEATIDPTKLQCFAPGTGEAGGLGNSTTLTSNGLTGQDEVCPTLPLIELDKQTVEGSPVENGDGTWTIAYDVTATNEGQTTGDYDLSDRLRYGSGIEVQSAAVVSGPEGIETNAEWTGQGAKGADENVIVTGIALDAGEVHTYRVEVIASMDRAVVTPGDLICPAPGSDAGGFANTAGLTHNGEDQDADACVSAPLIEITKSLSGAVTPVDGEDGVYDATYELTVANSGAGAGVYNLDDQLAPGDGVSVVGIQGVTSDAAEPVAINGGFNGIDDLRIVTDQPIASGADAPVVHTYTVTVRYAADLAGIEVPAGDVCTTAEGAPLPGTLNNTATVDWNGLDNADDECIRPGKPTLDKALVSATPIGNGQWEVVYDLTVGNTGNEATTYDLDDELLFAPQITVDTITATGPEGVEINGGFDGDGDQRIATDVAIIGLDDDGYTPHVYTVTVVANVPLQFEGDVVGDDGTASPACTVPGGNNRIEQGLNNAATLTDEAGGKSVDTDCAPVPSIDIVKAMDGAPVKGANGGWTVNYTITVQNDGAATGAYTVTDELRYGAGIEVLDATVVSAPEGITPAATWTGLGETGAEQNVIATDVALAAGSTHTYQVRVEARLDTSKADSTTLKCPAPGSNDRGGFANTAGVDHNDLTDDATACEVPEWPKDVPPPLATTGGEIAIGTIGAALLLMMAGGLLLYMRRRTAAEVVAE